LTRAGKEPAEDVKRAFRQAIKFAGLRVHGVRMYKSPEANGRLIHGAAEPDGWPHDLPTVELIATVGFDGGVSEVQIRCSATDGDPVMTAFSAPTLRDCSCGLEALPTTLKAVWVSRREVMAMVESGEAPPYFDGQWTWKPPDVWLPNID